MVEFFGIRKFHLMGVGGAGMSSIAHLLIKSGFEVSGCDIKKTKEIEELEKEGLKFFLGHSPKHVDCAEVLVYSSAIPENEEKTYSKSKIVTLSRIEMLSEIVRTKKTIAVIGSHGKTTTTSLITQALINAGVDPIAIIGGRIKNSGSTFLGKGELAVVECDESDKNFLKLSPVAIVLTNLDFEHIDKWGSFSSLKKAITDFINSLPFWGFCVLNGDDEGTKSIIPDIKRFYLKVSLEDGDITAKNISLSKKTKFSVFIKGEYIGDVETPLLGKHNIYNILFTIGVLYKIGIPLVHALKTFREFQGVERRIEEKGRINGITIISDYAHHPTEISASIEGIKQKFKGKIFLIFEPHRFSRVALLKEKFIQSISKADNAIITDIYPAGEENSWGVKIEDIIPSNGIYVPKENIIKKTLEEMRKLKSGDVIVFMGAGEIKSILENFLDTVGGKDL